MMPNDVLMPGVKDLTKGSISSFFRYIVGTMVLQCQKEEELLIKQIQKHGRQLLVDIKVYNEKYYKF